MQNQERLISFDSHQVRIGVQKSDIMRNIEQGQAGSSGVPETTVCRWCRTGYLPSIKVGGRWRIDPDVDLESLSNPMNGQVREGMKSKGWSADLKTTRILIRCFDFFTSINNLYLYFVLALPPSIT